MIKKYALVTGASSGIGLEISKILASIGFSLVLVARREEKLKGVTKTLINKYDITADYCVGDLENPNIPQIIYDFCHKKGYFISLLVNNAGYALPDTFHKTSMEAEEKFLRVLGVSVIALTKLFLIDMIKAKQGKIMMISSVAAFAPPSSIQTLYGPIKTFINRFSEGLNLSYNSFGITSTAVCPGYTVTNFHTASGVQQEMDSVPSFMKKPANRIAKEAVDDTLKGKRVCVPTKTYKVIVFLLKLLPHSLFPLFSKRLAPGRYENN
jgi:short-subunit dehydrogenase